MNHDIIFSNNLMIKTFYLNGTLYYWRSGMSIKLML